MSNSFRKISAIGLSLVTMVSLSGISPAFGATAADLQAQINALLAQIQSLQAQLGSTSGSTTTYSFTRDLTLGSTGNDVMALQQFLNSKGFTVATSGAGSPGNETTYFGSRTQAALGKYQASVGITPTAGYFGPKTRAYVASLAGGGTPGTIPGTPPPAGTALAVALASDTPAAKTIGSGTAFNPALKLTLTAGSSNVSITGITIQKSGFVANTRLNGIDVVDSAGVRHGQVVTSVNADNTITILTASDPIIVNAGTSGTLLVRFNLNSGDYSGTVSFGINSASAITLASGSVSGTFPITGNSMSVVYGGNALASTTLAILTSTGSSTLNVDPASEQEITKFRIAETSSQEGVYLNSWIFYNYGNAAATDYKDVQLVDQTGTVLATVQPSGQYVTFSLATPYFIDKGLTKDFTIKAKIVGGTTKTLKLVTYNNYDIDLRGATTGVSVLPSAVSPDTSFPIGNAYNQTTIGSGTITLQRAADSPSSAVTPGANNVVLAKFTAKPNGENYELRQVSFYIATSTTAGASCHALTGTVYVKVNGAIVYSVGASSLSSCTAAVGSVTVDLSSYPILTAGQDNAITIEASIPSTATAVDSYTVTNFDLTSVKRLVSNDLLSANDTGLNVSAVSGLQIAIQAAKLIVTTLSSPVANSVVLSTNKYEFAQIQLNAQAGGEDVKVNSILLTSTVGTTNAGLTDVAGLEMYKDNDTSPLPTTASTATNAATVTFSFSTAIVVPKATPVTLHLKANVVADTDANNTGTIKFNVASTSAGSISATGATTGNTLTNGSDITYAGIGQAMTIVSSGNLILSVVSGSGASPSANQVLNIGTTNIPLFAFKMTSQYEAQKITSLTIRASSTTGTVLATTTLQNIKLYEGNASTPFAQAPQFDSCSLISGANATSSDQHCKVTFTAADNLLSAPVPSTGVTITVKADVAPGGTAILGNNFYFLIASTTADYAVKGAVSSLTTGTKTGTPAAGGTSYIVPQTVSITGISPLTAIQAGSSNAGIGAGYQFAVFKITNNGGAAVYISTSTTFRFAQSGTTTSSFDLYISPQNGSIGAATTKLNTLSASTSITTSGYVTFTDLSGASTTNRKIDGGAYRYLVVKSVDTTVTGRTTQFSVAALNDIRFDVQESDLGYDGNGNGTLTEAIGNLPVDGIPSLETISAL